MKRLNDHRNWLDSIEVRGSSCNASTRKGTPCKRRDLFSNGCCKLHGGLSTGPTTAAGKRKSALNGVNGGRPKKQSP